MSGNQRKKEYQHLCLSNRHFLKYMQYEIVNRCDNTSSLFISCNREVFQKANPAIQASAIVPPVRYWLGLDAPPLKMPARRLLSVWNDVERKHPHWFNCKLRKNINRLKQITLLYEVSMGHITLIRKLQEQSSNAFWNDVGEVEDYDEQQFTTVLFKRKASEPYFIFKK